MQGELMLIRREPEEITTWLLAFTTWIPNRWSRWLIPGKFKHVSMFAWSPAARVWLIVDPSYGQTKITVLPDGQDALDRIARFTDGCAVLKIDAKEPKPVFRLRPLLCTTVARHLIGLPTGALWPDALWRDCIAAGAVRIE
jgi:hypothetical protein